MTSVLAERHASLVGSQRPRVLWAPERVSTAGPDVVELAASVGLQLDPWQQLALVEALGERADGRWSAFEVGLVVARQNGKGAVLEAREIGGLFLLGEELILHSAHEFKTAREAFLRVEALVRGSDELYARVDRIRTSHGEEGIELKPTRRVITDLGATGGKSPRLRFVARSKSSGRGFSGDCVILDEAMILPETAIGALMPTMSARPNPQLWYTGSAGDAESTVLARVRRRGVAGGDPSLCYLEWAADEDADPTDPQQWAAANPGLGIRISAEHVTREQRSMDHEQFARERLGVGDWPDPESLGGTIPLQAWLACQVGRDHAVTGAKALAVDVTPDRAVATIALVGRAEDGRAQVEVVDQRRGTDWVPQRMAGLLEHKPCAVVVDPGSPAGSLIPDLDRAGVEVEVVTLQEYAAACGAIYDAAVQGHLCHLGDPKLTAAVQGAGTRKVSRDAWAWKPKGATSISPLIAATLALHGFVAHASDTYDLTESVW